MAMSALATGLLLSVVLAGLEVIELLNEREREEFENS